jgi:hypothetical protein
MRLSQSGKGYLLVIGSIFVIVAGGLWYFFTQVDHPLEGIKTEDMHFEMSQEGVGTHIRAKQGYGVILECEGWIQSPPSPPGLYNLKVIVDDDVVFQGKIAANQKHRYKMKTRFGTGMTYFSHELKNLDGLKGGLVTYYFKYTYSYTSIIDRLLAFDF